MKLLIGTFFSWLPLAVAITGLSGLVYLAVQQNMRQDANDPQIQLAEDSAEALLAGETPLSVIPRGNFVDIAKSIAPWITIYDSSGKPLASSGFLDNAPPELPQGLFDDRTWIDPKKYYIDAGVETRVTWQPREEIRQAIVVVHDKDGTFVVSGRSLRVVEERIGVLNLHAFLAWFVTMGASLLFVLLALFFKRIKF